MSTINQLSAIDAPNSADQLPLYSTSNGDARRLSLGRLVDWLSDQFQSLTVARFVRVTPVTVANLPSAASAGAGARAFVTDATSNSFHALVVGGGANSVPVFVDNTQWRIG